MATEVNRENLPLKLNNFNIGYDDYFRKHNCDSLYTHDYQPHGYVDIVNTMKHPTCGAVIASDYRVKDGVTEAVHSFIDHKTRKFGREYDQNSMRKTNFKMNSDSTKLPFEISNYDRCFQPKQSSKLASCRSLSDNVAIGNVDYVSAAVSTYKDKFGPHDVNRHKLIKSYSRHYDSCIIRDNDHCYSTTSKDAFPAVFAPRIKPIYPQGTSIPCGDQDKINEFTSTMKDAYPVISDKFCRPIYDSAVASGSMRKTNMKQYDGGIGDGYTSLTVQDFCEQLGKQSVGVIVERNKSCMPRGDEDPGRCKDIVSTTTNDVEFSGDVHYGHHNPIVKGADILTKSNVYFAPSNLKGAYYEATTPSVYVPIPCRKTYDRTDFHIPSSIPVHYYDNDVAFETTTGSAYLNQGIAKMSINPDGKDRIRRSHIAGCEDQRDFSTTTHEHFTNKSAAPILLYDSHKLQCSSVPLGTLH